MKRLFALLLLTMVPASLEAHGNLAFTNGTWFNGTTFEKRPVVYSVDNRIRLAWDGKIDQTIDLGGRFVVPPFADAHTHAFAEGMSLEPILTRYLRRGIFYVKNPNSTVRLTQPLRARLNTPETVDVSYSFGGLTASGGHPTQIYASLAGKPPFAGWSAKDMENQAWFAIDSVEDLDRKWPLIIKAKPDFIKTYLEYSEDREKNRGLSAKVLAAIVRRAHGAGLRVTTHVASRADFRTAVDSGVDEIAHLPLERITEDDAKSAVTAKTVVVTTTLSHRPTRGITDIDALHRSNLTVLRAAGVSIALGTDGDATVVEEAENIYRLGVFPAAELMRIWTTSTPLTIFLTRKIGCLSEGCEASFLALDASPIEDFKAVRRISMRVKQGHIIVVPPELPSVADILFPIATASGVDAAFAEYDRLLKASPAAYRFGEAEVNRLGYALLRAGKMEDAIAVFKYNTAHFPSSANAWDSLGEGYMGAGDNKAAIDNFRKSLQLNPHNENASEMLRKLGADP